MGTGYNDCKVGNQLLYNTRIAAQTIFLMVKTRLRVKRGGGAVHSVDEDLPLGVRWVLGIMTVRWVINCCTTLTQQRSDILNGKQLK